MNFATIHPIGYEERSHSHHIDLFKAFDEHLPSRGHKLTDAFSADVVVFDSGEWDTGGGIYCSYDWKALTDILLRKVPIVFIENFDHGGAPNSMSAWVGQNNWELCKDLSAEHDYAKFMYTASRSCFAARILFFMRKMQISQPYPEWVFPLEYPLFDEFPLASKEELFARPYDLCLLCNLSYPRATSLCDMYRDGRLIIDGQIITDRLDHNEWVDRHRHAKMFIEADASLGSERPMRLMTIAPMLRIKSDHRLPFPREDMVHQVVVGDYMGHVSRDDVDKILSVVRNPDRLYEIYINGVKHMRKHYSVEARNNYMLDVIEKFLSA